MSLDILTTMILYSPNTFLHNHAPWTCAHWSFLALGLGTATLGQGQSPFYNPPGVRGCNPPLGCFGSDPAARRGKPVIESMTCKIFTNSGFQIRVLKKRKITFFAGWNSQLDGAQISLRRSLWISLLNLKVVFLSIWSTLVSYDRPSRGSLSWHSSSPGCTKGQKISTTKILTEVVILSSSEDIFKVVLPFGPASPRTPVPGKEDLAAPGG